MLCYKDMSFCSASYKEAEKPCIYTECFRHLSKVPENLPDYMPVAVSDFLKHVRIINMRKFEIGDNVLIRTDLVVGQVYKTDSGAPRAYFTKQMTKYKGKNY